VNAKVTSLNEQIAAFVSKMAKNAPPAVLASLDVEIKKLADTGISEKALKVGAEAPNFRLPNAQGGTFELSTQLSKGPVVVTFYRGGWCPYCDLTLRAYQANLSGIRLLGADLVAISPQTEDYSMSAAEKKGLEFPVLSDLRNAVARQYGIVFQLPDAWRELQTKFGNPMPKFNGDESWELPIPATFVLDRRGTVRLRHVDPDYRRRLEPEAILRSLREIRG
jgi:peroxiredoxin